MSEPRVYGLHLEGSVKKRLQVGLIRSEVTPVVGDVFRIYAGAVGVPGTYRVIRREFVCQDENATYHNMVVVRLGEWHET